MQANYCRPSPFLALIWIKQDRNRKEPQLMQVNAENQAGDT